jgi:copper chaperone CopZ
LKANKLLSQLIIFKNLKFSKMNSLKYLMTALAMLSFIASNAQIKNAKTESVKIYGNCGMCETTIEKAGNLKKTAEVDWNKDTKIATITYDEKKTNQDEILKRIALSGYDSDKFLAPDDVYAKLPECCQYERVNKTVTKTETSKNDTSKMEMHDHSAMRGTPQNANQLKAVFDNYFSIKDALVKSDGNTASAKAKDLSNAISSVKMETLTTEEHTVWMKVMKDLAFDAEHIAETKDVGHQRDHFTSLSDNIYKLIKVSKQETSVYYQHCPMFNDGKGANWLSKENAIKNPYYGSSMLSCGPERNGGRNQSQSHRYDDLGSHRYYGRLCIFCSRGTGIERYGFLLGVGNPYRDYAFGTLVRNAFYNGSFKSIAVIGGTFAKRCYCRTKW